jgi:hypothetical protein
MPAEFPDLPGSELPSFRQLGFMVASGLVRQRLIPQVHNFHVR